MAEVSEMAEQSWDNRKQISAAVHDLCQPLTTLQCRLELATLTCTPESYREAVEDGLLECRRMVDAVELIREILRAESQEASDKEIKWEQ
jgi:signal transduction histidine kinase